MQTTGQRWTVRTHEQLGVLSDWLTSELDAGRTRTLQLMEADRTTAQNAMFYALYRDIAAAMQDKSLVEVKRECKLRYGVAIRKGGDPEWAAFYNEAIKPMTYEQKLMLMDDYPITSKFTKDQASEYIDTILSEYAKIGVPIPDPRS